MTQQRAPHDHDVHIPRTVFIRMRRHNPDVRRRLRGLEGRRDIEKLHVDGLRDDVRWEGEGAGCVLDVGFGAVAEEVDAHDIRELVRFEEDGDAVGCHDGVVRAVFSEDMAGYKLGWYYCASEVWE